MPTFYTDNFDISVDEFLNNCSQKELDEIIDYLVSEGHVKRSNFSEYNSSINEMIFEDSLNKLHGKYTSLSKEDEDRIHKIASKF